MAHNRLPPEDQDDVPLPKITYWIFDENGEPKSVGQMEYIRWAFVDENSNALKKTTVGDVEVSTVLLMSPANIFGQPPLIFETMIFGGEHDEYTYRYYTKAEALLGHDQAVQLVKQAQQMKAAGETVSEWLARNHPSFN